MALAKYFEKAALSAQSVLASFNLADFRRTLETQVLELRFGVGGSTSEGRRTLELLTDMLSRLYPRLRFSATADVEGMIPQLANRARQINARVAIEQDCSPTLTVVVGKVSGPLTERTFYTGSDGWLCHVSTERSSPCGDSENPFGAGMAACLAAAWAFRETFAVQLAAQEAPREDLSVSLLDLSSGQCAANPHWKPADIGVTHLVGVGAIGHATAWALSGCAGLTGTLYLIDGERLELSNLQRYVSTTEDDVGTAKTDLGARLFNGLDGLRVLSVPQVWESFVAERDVPIDRVLLALDSAEERIRVQGSLPRWIANAWTQPENVGVSRHRSFLSEPCVACLYMASGPRKNLDQLIAEALGLTSEPELYEVRALLHTGRPVGREFLMRVCERIAAPLDTVLAFENVPLESFYANGVCGGLLVPFVAHGHATQIQVPMAFQSATAGLLLAAELIADASNLRAQRLPTRSDVNLLRAIGGPGWHPHSHSMKHESGRCICQDPTFRHAYQRRWGVSDGDIATS